MTLKKLVGGQGIIRGISSSYLNGLILNQVENSVMSVREERLDTSSASDVHASYVTKDSKYFLFGIQGGMLVFDLETKEVVNVLSQVLGAYPSVIKQHPITNEIFIGIVGSPHLVRYSYPGFVHNITALDIGTGVNDFAFNSDGSIIALALVGSPYIKIYDTSTWNEISYSGVDFPTDQVYSVAFSTNGEMLATYGVQSGSRIRIFEYPSGNSIFISSGTSAQAGKFVVASNDNNYFYFIKDTLSSSQQQVFRYDVVGDSLTTISFPAYISRNNSGAGPRNAIYTPDDLLFISGRGYSLIWDAVEDKILGWTNLDNQVTTPQAALSPKTGKRKVTGTVTDILEDPIARRIVVFDQDSDTYLGEAMSDAITGEYEVRILSPDPVYVIAVGEDGERHKIASGVTPVPGW